VHYSGCDHVHILSFGLREVQHFEGNLRTQIDYYLEEELYGMFYIFKRVQVVFTTYVCLFQLSSIINSRNGGLTLGHEVVVVNIFGHAKGVCRTNENVIHLVIV
jgi:hypothetical protein